MQKVMGERWEREKWVKKGDRRGGKSGTRSLANTRGTKRKPAIPSIPSSVRKTRHRREIRMGWLRKLDSEQRSLEKPGRCGNRGGRRKVYKKNGGAQP